MEKSEILGSTDEKSKEKTNDDMEYKKEFGEEKLARINQIRKENLKTYIAGDIENVSLPTPKKNGEVEYVVSEEIPDCHYLSGKIKRFEKLKYQVKEKYDDGNLVYVEITNPSLSKNDIELYYLDDNKLEMKIERDSYYPESDYTKTLYGPTGKKEYKEIYKSNEFEYESTKIFYDDKGEELSYETEQSHSDNSFEKRFYQYKRDDNGEKRLLFDIECRESEEDYDLDVYFTDGKGRKITYDEFLFRFPEKKTELQPYDKNIRDYENTQYIKKEIDERRTEFYDKDGILLKKEEKIGRLTDFENNPWTKITFYSKNGNKTMEVETCPMDEKYRNYEKLHLIEYDEITGEEKTNLYREYRNENGGEIITERLSMNGRKFYDSYVEANTSYSYGDVYVTNISEKYYDNETGERITRNEFLNKAQIPDKYLPGCYEIIPIKLQKGLLPEDCVNYDNIEFIETKGSRIIEKNCRDKAGKKVKMKLVPSTHNISEVKEMAEELARSGNISDISETTQEMNLAEEEAKRGNGNKHEQPDDNDEPNK